MFLQRQSTMAQCHHHTVLWLTAAAHLVWPGLFLTSTCFESLGKFALLLIFRFCTAHSIWAWKSKHWDVAITAVLASSLSQLIIKCRVSQGELISKEDKTSCLKKEKKSIEINPWIHQCLCKLESVLLKLGIQLGHGEHCSSFKPAGVSSLQELEAVLSSYWQWHQVSGTLAVIPSTYHLERPVPDSSHLIIDRASCVSLWFAVYGMLSKVGAEKLNQTTIYFSSVWFQLLLVLICLQAAAQGAAIPTHPKLGLVWCSSSRRSSERVHSSHFVLVCFLKDGTVLLDSCLTFDFLCVSGLTLENLQKSQLAWDLSLARLPGFPVECHLYLSAEEQWLGFGAASLRSRQDIRLMGRHRLPRTPHQVAATRMASGNRRTPKSF